MQDFDPTAGAMQQEFENCSIGKTPTGFPKIHVEMVPADLIKLIGYDPRSMRPPARRGQAQVDPAHVSQEVLDLVREVQRSIDQCRVNEMVAYLHNALSNGNYADWAEIDAVTVSKPDLTHWKDTHKAYFPTSAEYFITDGQHRYCALMDFVRQYPEMASRFTQAVAISVLPQDRLAEWSGQSFHDKNYLQMAVKMTKALAVDARDLHNSLAKALHEHSVIKNGGGVNDAKDALAANAKEFATHAALYRFTRGFCEGRRGLDKPPIKNPNLSKDTYEKLKEQLFQYVDELNTGFPNWTVVPGREDYLFRSSPALQALGVFGHVLYTKVANQAERKKMIVQIGERKLDWRRSNVAEWDSVIGIKITSEDSGAEWITPRASRQSIDGTIKFLRDRSGLTEYLMVDVGSANDETLEVEA